MSIDSALTLSIAAGSTFTRIEVPDVEVTAQARDGTPRSARLGLSPLSLGTSPDCDLVLEDSSVSRQHARLTLTERGLIVRDLESKNGTYVNGVRVIEAHVRPNDTLALANVRITVRPASSTRSMPLAAQARFGQAHGGSVVMRSLFAQLERVATTDEPVLLQGESGTGKEVLAHAIHEASRRAEAPFVVLDCGAVAPTLIESELFGHLKGAFTGANTNRQGLFEQASGGTLFMDEIGELPLELQPRLLRALERSEIRPVGASTYRRVDARIIAATHRNLRGMVAEGKFREDLYYRLAILDARIPPLRERREDIPLLVEHFLSSFSPPRTLADLGPGVLELLKAHHWPGNVRELHNTVTRLVLFPGLGAEAIRAEGRTPSAPHSEMAFMQLPLREARDGVVREFERRYVAAQLERAGGNVTQAARAMGVSRQFLHRLMTRYGVGD